VVLFSHATPCGLIQGGKYLFHATETMNEKVLPHLLASVAFAGPLPSCIASPFCTNINAGRKPLGTATPESSVWPTSAATLSLCLRVDAGAAVSRLRKSIFLPLLCYFLTQERMRKL